LLGEVDERLGNPLEAVREYQRAAELNPTESNLFDWGAELLMHRAVEPALEVFTKGNRLFPRSVRMLAGLGASWYALGSYDHAAQRLCEASELNPDDPDPYLFMGKMQAVETTQSEAIVERLERFVRLQPGNALANYYYAVSLWKQRKSPENATDSAQVKILLEKAVHLDPKLGPAYLQLGVLYSERKDLSNAISAISTSDQGHPRLEERTNAWRRPTGRQEKLQEHRQSCNSTHKYQRKRQTRSNASATNSSSSFISCGTERRRRSRNRTLFFGCRFRGRLSRAQPALS
jgi:tetratricopeptide (TPR) repeat protein